MQLRPAVSIFLLVSLLAFGSGCSVLGIATKGDLEEQEARSQAREKALAEQAETLGEDLEEIARGLAEFESDLQTRLSVMQSDLDGLNEVREDLTTFGKRLEIAQQEMTILEGQVRRDLVRLDGEVSTATEQAQDSQLRSRHVMDSALAGLRGERDTLRRQLEQVEELLDGWSQWESVASSEEPSLRQETDKR